MSRKGCDCGAIGGDFNCKITADHLVNLTSQSVRMIALLFIANQMTFHSMI